MFTPNAAPTHTHDTRNRNIETTPVPRTASAADTLRYYLPQFMETAPKAIRDKVNTQSFKGFTHYVKMSYINSYSAVCDIPNCYATYTVTHSNLTNHISWTPLYFYFFVSYFLTPLFLFIYILLNARIIRLTNSLGYQTCCAIMPHKANVYLFLH